MVVSSRISGAVAALVITLGACADGPDVATAPRGPDATAGPLLNMRAMAASSRAIGDEGSRLAMTVDNDEQRAQLSASLDQLSRALKMGDVLSARRAIAAARDGSRFLQSDADQDALDLVLDAAEQSLSSTSMHGATR